MPEEFFAAIRDQATPPVYRFFTGKAWVESGSGKTVEVRSPIDDSVVGALQVVTTAEIDAVITAAKTAQAAWEATPLNQRVKVMHLAADWVRHFEEYMTTLLAKEIGKTTEEAKSEVKRTADLIDYYADEAQSMRGETLDSDNFPGYDKGRIGIIERVAWGTVLAIAPFNYPVNLSASKIAPALLMGNSVVFKPPTRGGISALHLAQIFVRAGIAQGALSVVTGTGGEIGDYLVSHPGVDCITFTGSSDTGEAIAKRAGMKPLVFECGGNNPAIVLPDADMSLAACEIVKGAFSYAGQRCTAIKYVLAMSATMEQLTPMLLRELGEKVKMGDPRSPETRLVGPVVSQETAGEIEGHIQAAVKNGATVLAGGKRSGSYIEPTILTNVNPDWTICSCEVFGPILSLVPVASVQEAIATINRSRFALQASVFTKDEGAGIVIAKQLNVGTIQINGSPQRGPDHFPFLGVKRSGLGVQGVRYSLEEMSRLRPIVINKPA